MSSSKYNIQFQKGLGLPEFIKLFGTEEKCQENLFKTKWKDGFRCSKCNSTHYSRFSRKGREYFQCSDCHHQHSLTSNTLFHGSHLPLQIWYMAIYLISESKKSISSLELHRLIHVNHKTAWLMLHKIMKVMTDVEISRKLEGRIEVDDAYLGGKRSGGKRGRGADGKQPFIVAVQTSKTSGKYYPIFTKLTPIESFKKDIITEWATDYISKESTVVSDGLPAFSGIDEVCDHETHIASEMTEEDKQEHFRCFNTILSNIKTSLSGTFHSFNAAKNSELYLGAIMYRFNHRFDLNKIFSVLLRQTISHPPVVLAKL
jgi:hypothetical protein